MAPVLRPPASRSALAPHSGHLRGAAAGADICPPWSSGHVEVGRARHPRGLAAGRDRGGDRRGVASAPAVTDRAAAALAAINPAPPPAPTPFSLFPTPS